MVGKWWCKEIHEQKKEKDLSIVAKTTLPLQQHFYATSHLKLL
jgi:hypothetical protein